MFLHLQKLCTAVYEREMSTPPTLLWSMALLYLFYKLCTVEAMIRVTSCLENLEMSGILTAVMILLQVREVSGRKSCQGKVAILTEK